MAKKVLITGVNGLLGKDVLTIFSESNYEVYGIGRSEKNPTKYKYIKLDLTEFNVTEKMLADIAPDIVIHLAAYTKLDDCETNKEYAYKMNVKVTEILAHNVPYLVYMSSDAVFSGKKTIPYEIEDICDPVNYYGLTKYEGEKAAMQAHQSLILRSSIYGFSKEDNISIAEWGVKNLMSGNEITGFDDVYFNPLYSAQLARLIFKMTNANLTGIYHAGSDKEISKYTFFHMLAEKLGQDTSLVKKGSVDSISFKAQRTKYTVLDTKKIVSELGYSSDMNLDLGIDELLKDLEQNKPF